MFLTDEEIQALTDYTSAKAQCRWFSRNAYPFEVSSRGRPRVLRSVVEDRLGGPIRRQNDGFNLDAAKKAS